MVHFIPLCGFIQTEVASYFSLYIELMIKGILYGVITSTNTVFLETGGLAMLVREIMTPETHILSATEPIEAAINLFREKPIHAIPVTDGDVLIGIITLSAVYQFLSRAGHYSSCPIEWIMKKPSVWISPEAPIREAVLLMKDTQIYTLPVVEDGKIIGLISIELLLDFLLDKLVD